MNNILSLAIVFLVLTNAVNSGIVYTRFGFVKGKTFRSRCGRWFEGYFGIPYASPPVGNLRLRPPIEAPSWIGIKECLQAPPRCIQPKHICDVEGDLIGQEDCLYLNVFAPKKISTKWRKPVIVYIHGGSFQVGDVGSYGAEYFQDHEVVIVTMNYRLGPLGFLAMGNQAISGNYGLKDQLLALRWVKMNIDAFGGNPNSITLMGHDTGAVSVHLHLFSPLSKGLFNKVIMQSGSAHSTWAYYEEYHTRQLGQKFANVTGCYDEDDEKMLECFQKLPVEEMIRKQKELYIWKCNPMVLFKPAIETGVKDAFLPQKPGPSTYVTTSVPWLTGITSSEASALVTPYLENDGKLANEINEAYLRLIPIVCEYLYTIAPDCIRYVTKRIKEFYFGPRPISAETDVELVNMISDALYTYPLITSILYDKGKRFVYLYDHKGNFSSETMTNCSKYLGVPHSDELPLLFHVPDEMAQMYEDDLKVSQRLVKYWFHFAKYANPNGNQDSEKVWKHVTSDNVEFLLIRTTSDQMDKNLFKSRYRFWNSLPFGR